MSITIIAAVAANNIIGNSQMKKLPWKVPEEMKFFREQTMGRTVVMGRKTAEETGNLPGRDCIVLSKDPKYQLKGFVAMTLDQFLRLNESTPDCQYFVCGGAEIYKAVMPYAARATISYLDLEAYGDIMMPALPISDWKKVSAVEKSMFVANTYSNTGRIVYDTIISQQLLTKKRTRKIKEKQL